MIEKENIGRVNCVGGLVGLEGNFPFMHVRSLTQRRRKNPYQTQCYMTVSDFGGPSDFLYFFFWGRSKKNKKERRCVKPQNSFPNMTKNGELFNLYFLFPKFDLLFFLVFFSQFLRRSPPKSFVLLTVCVASLLQGAYGSFRR